MFDILNKKNAFIAVAVILILCGMMCLMIGTVTLSKGCVEQTFDVVALDDGVKVLMATIDGEPVVPTLYGNVDIDGVTMTMWYNAKDNIAIPNYYLQTYGCIAIGLVLSVAGGFILNHGLKKKGF